MLLFAASALSCAIFVADTITQLEIAIAVMYVAVILIVVRILERPGVLLVTLVCVTLTIVSYFISREDSTRSTGFINCVISIAAIVASTYLALQNRSAQTALHQAQTNLAHANRVTTMGELTAAIVHEVNQPIAGVVANAEAAMRWLEAKSPDLTEIQQALEAIVEDGKRTSDIVSRIRALFKNTPPHSEIVDINEIVIDVIDLMRPQMQRANVVVKTEFDSDFLSVAGDRVQLQQVILNLILNAVEAMANVNNDRLLYIGAKKAGAGGVLVEVTDLGSGLSTNVLDQLFDAFYTTKPSGMGMGLSICRTIVMAHGGRIWAEPNDGGGATFRFLLPKPAELVS
ncbi:hypothetical protein A4A58_21045 [Tardiphaga robiniae]|uniref:histidine kinase n=2 Tax=Tardiphaga robiniae TaxID=943830 RepID=A0A164AHP8_9BRAD|nr:hypothetical protein A4A58_21045 [Tardiphaga robiniae]